MSSILAESEFIEADITYNETKEYPYLFNVVAFNDVTLDWVIVSRVRIDKQDGNAYALAFSKTFQKCKSDHPSFEPGKTLKGVVVDWSDAEIKGLGQAVGQDIAIQLLKGCSIHWTRSWQRVRDRVATTSNDKSREKYLFALIASQIQKAQSGSIVTKCFQVLCRVNKSTSLVGVVPGLLLQDSTFIDKQCDWSAATRWAEWWMQPRHLQMLHKDFSLMDNDIWDRFPADTNAVERKNQDSKDKIPQQLQSAMINLYKADKYMCTKHMAAMDGTSITYSDRSCEGRKKTAVSRSKHRAKKFESDPNAMHGPPDRQNHFQKSTITKRYVRNQLTYNYTVLCCTSSLE